MLFLCVHNVGRSQMAMGCEDACPVFPDKRCLDWTLDDPAAKTVDDIRHIRDDIERRIRGLFDDLDASSQH